MSRGPTPAEECNVAVLGKCSHSTTLPPTPFARLRQQRSTLAPADQCSMLPQHVDHGRHRASYGRGTVMPAFLRKLCNVKSMNFEIAAYHMLEMLRNPDKVCVRRVPGSSKYRTSTPPPHSFAFAARRKRESALHAQLVSATALPLSPHATGAEQTNMWAREDPAFLVLQCLLLAVGGTPS